MRVKYLFFLFFLLAPSHPCSAGDQERAKTKFKEGIELFKQESYDDALIAFEESYRLKPKPQVLYNIAMCHQALFQYPEAIAAFNRLIEEGSSKLKRNKLKTAQESLEKLLSLVGTVTLDQAPDGAELILNDKTVGTTPLTKPLYLNPGDYRVQLKLDGYHTLDTRITVVAEALIKVHAALQPIKQEPVEPPVAGPDQTPGDHFASTDARVSSSGTQSGSGVSAMFITSLCLMGLGAGGVGIGGYFTSKHNDLAGDLGSLGDQLKAGDITKPQYDEKWDETNDEISKSNVGMAVGYGVGGALMATGVVLLIIDLVSETDEQPSAVAVFPTYNGIALTY